MDPIFLETLDMCDTSIRQLISTGDTTDLFTSRLETANREGKRRVDLITPSFTLDIPILMEESIVNAYNLLGQCSVKNIRIDCSVFGLGRPSSIAQVLKVLDWPATGALELVGTNINRWIQFMAEINAPHLKRLQIYATGRGTTWTITFEYLDCPTIARLEPAGGVWHWCYAAG